jgi:hypothetical protein
MDIPFDSGDSGITILDAANEEMGFQAIRLHRAMGIWGWKLKRSGTIALSLVAACLLLVPAVMNGQPPAATAADAAMPAWRVGVPIVTYWAGPGSSSPMTEAAAKQLADGGWNVAWCHENELDVVGKFKLRGQLSHPLLSPATLDDPAKLKELDELIGRVSKHPALYFYFLGDEPSAKNFPGMQRLVDYLRKKDPKHPAYINLFPTYASNEQLGAQGDTVTAYKKYVGRFVDTVHPSLLSYDHYQFAKDHDLDDYFLNLGLMRRAAQDAKTPFLNIVQACTWTPAMRETNEAEMRYLVYTTLAYGAQGISYYVYSHPGHSPGIATEGGKPTRVYDWLKPLNRDFVAIASQLQSLESQGVFHAGMLPPGAVPIPDKSGFRFDPPLPSAKFEPGTRVRGFIIGIFGPEKENASHAVVVNLDYKDEQRVTLKGPARLERFDPASGKWNAATSDRMELRIPAGGGELVRVRR